MNKCMLSCENEKNLITQNPEFPSIFLGKNSDFTT